MSSRLTRHRWAAALLAAVTLLPIRPTLADDSLSDDPAGGDPPAVECYPCIPPIDPDVGVYIFGHRPMNPLEPPRKWSPDANCGGLACFDMSEGDCAANEMYWMDGADWNGTEPECCDAGYREALTGWNDTTDGTCSGDRVLKVFPDDTPWDQTDNTCVTLQTLEEAQAHLPWALGGTDPCRWECQAYATSVVDSAPPDCPLSASMSCGSGASASLGRGEFQLHEVDFQTPGLVPDLPVTMARTHRSRHQVPVAGERSLIFGNELYKGSEAFGEGWFFPWEMTLRASYPSAGRSQYRDLVLLDGRGRMRHFFQQSNRWDLGANTSGGATRWQDRYVNSENNDQINLVDRDTCRFELVTESSITFEFETVVCDLAEDPNHPNLDPNHPAPGASTFPGLYPLGRDFVARLARVVDSFGNALELQYTEREEMDEGLAQDLAAEHPDLAFLRFFEPEGHPASCDDHPCFDCLMTGSGCDDCRLNDPMTYFEDCQGFSGECLDPACVDCLLPDSSCPDPECAGYDTSACSFDSDYSELPELLDEDLPCFGLLHGDEGPADASCTSDQIERLLPQISVSVEPKTPRWYLTSVVNDAGTTVLSWDWERIPNLYDFCFHHGDCWLDRVVASTRQDGATWTYDYDRRDTHSNWYSWFLLDGLEPERGSWPGLLTSVTSPPVEGVEDLEDGETESLTRSYSYSTPAPIWTSARITEIRDAFGLVLKNEYYEEQVLLTEEQVAEDVSSCGAKAGLLRSGRLARQTRGDAAHVEPQVTHYHYEISLPDLEIPHDWTPDTPVQQPVLDVIVNDHGRVSHHGFDSLGREKRTRRYTGLANPDEPTTSKENRPTVASKKRQDDPEYYQSHAEHLGRTRKASFAQSPGGSQVLTVPFRKNHELLPRLQARQAESHRLSQPYEMPPPEWLDDGAPLNVGLEILATSYQYDFQSDSGACCASLDQQAELHGVVTRERQHLTDDLAFGPTGGVESVPWLKQTTRGYHETLVTSNQTVQDKDGVLHELSSGSTTPDLLTGRPTHSRSPRAHVPGRSGDDGLPIVVESEQRYYESGPSQGLVKESIADPEGLKLTTSFAYDLAGRVKTRTDPNGNTTETEHNALGWVLATRSPAVDLDGDGPLPAQTIETRNYYDRAGRVVRTEVDRVVPFNSADAANSTWTTRFTYDTRGRLLAQEQEVEPGVFMRIENDHDVFGNIIETRRAGATSCEAPFDRTRFEFDAQGRLFRQVEAPQLSEADPCGLGTSADELVTQTDYDAEGKVIRTVVGVNQPEPQVATMEYDGFGRLRVTVDPVGNRTALTPDWAGNVVHELIEGNDGSGTSVRLGETDRDVLADGRILSSSVAFFDILSQLPIDEGAAQSSTTWCLGCELPVVQLDHHGNPTDLFYDRVNRSRRTLDPVGNETEIVYDPNGNVIEEISREISQLTGEVVTRSTHHGYDVLNRRSWTKAPDGGVTRFFHDSVGNVVLTIDPLGGETAVTHDGLGRVLTTEQRPRPGAPPEEKPIVTRMVHDDAGRLVARVDDNGHETGYLHDDRGRVETTIYADKTFRLVEHDAFGNERNIVEADGLTEVTHVHDAANRLVAKVVSIGSGGADPDTSYETYTHDGLGRIVFAEDDDSEVERAYDSLGNMTTEIVREQGTDRELTVQRHVDAMGLVRSKTYPSGRVIELEPRMATRGDVLGPLPEVRAIKQTAPELAYIATYDYLGRGRAEQVARNRGLVTRTYFDEAGRVKRQEHRTDGALIDDRELQWDLVGNKLSELDLLGGKARTYGYDSFDRLVSSTIQVGLEPPATTTYDLDGVQNRKTVTVGGAVQGYTMDSTLHEDGGAADFQVNAYTTSPLGTHLYDPRGNLVETQGDLKWTYDYDYRNRLVRARRASDDLTVEFARDVFGRVFRKSTTQLGATESRYRANDELQVLEEFDEAGELIASYVHGLYLDSLLQADIEGQSLWFVTDDLASVRVVTGYGANLIETVEYDDYGWPTVLAGGVEHDESTVGNPFLFTGRRWEEELSLYDYRARYMDPRLGRFTTRDPIGIWGDDLNLGNGYAYVGNNPLSRIDPLGTASVPADWANNIDGAIDSLHANVKYGGDGSWDDVATDFLVATGGDIAKGFSDILRLGTSSYEATEAWEQDDYLSFSLLIGQDVLRTAEIILPGARALRSVRHLDDAFETADSALQSTSATRAADSLGGHTNCFVAGTLVHVPGGTKPIEALEEGDQVVTLDPETGLLSHHPVLRTFETPKSTVVTLVLADDLGLTEEVTVTPEHPMWIHGTGWTPAGEVPEGAPLLSAAGTTIRLSSRREVKQPHAVFNIEVASAHTYLIATPGVLVHNTCPAELARTAATEAADAAQSLSPRPGAAGALQVGDRTFTATSMRGADPPTLHPEVQRVLDSIPTGERSRSHGRCVEPSCISQALDAGVDPRGGVSHVRQVKAPGKPKHQRQLPACPTCEVLLDEFDLVDGAR
ncbi:MAG: RHS repeat-associated core domain-containing protein [Acidobacteriota bacterium]